MKKWFQHKIVTLLIGCLMLLSCVEIKTQNNYFSDVGEISFDKQFDDASFELCHEDILLLFSYNGMGFVYEGEKTALVKTIRDNFSYPETKGETGFITIRFIVNCEGKAGRFRITEMGLDLKAKTFDKNLSSQLLNSTKNLEGWKVFEQQGKTWDYQQYLTFKIVDGTLIAILP